ncbi:MAG: hypothetical protein GX973_07855 [Firmicutes bacterium]|nr:hypothetical protein [Bacillota bacterium]NMA93012.1 hypothetical protein [Bacillota bacterium]
MKGINQPVSFSVEFGVNYITHLYTLAGAGFEDKSYLEKYGDSIIKEELECLKANAHLMSFLRRDHGPFAGLLYFTPSYFNFTSQDEFAEYLHSWARAVKQRDFALFEKYSLNTQNDIGLFQVDDDTWENQVLPLEKIFTRLGRIFVDNLDSYKTEIWPEVQPIFMHRAEALNTQIQPNLINRWEEITGYKFEPGKYKVVLFFAGADGPSWNNVALHKNTAFYNHDAKHMLTMLSHEIGIHTLLPHFRETISDFEDKLPDITAENLYGNVSYMAFESLAAFYNEKILKKAQSTGQASNDYPLFKDIYDALYHPKRQPLDLYVKGIRLYLDKKIAPRDGVPL